MVVQRKNLLEAFRDAGSATKREPEPPAGPFAQGGAPPSARSPRQALVAPALGVWLARVLVLAVVFAVGFALGRKGSTVAARSAGSALEEARESALQTAPLRVEEPPPGRPAVPAAGSVAGDLAPLYDPANRYTIIAATYDGSHQDLAWATHDLLRDAGLSVWPVAERGGRYLVLVDAAPEARLLESSLRRLTRLESWDGTLAYADAYAARIDSIVDR